MGLEGSSGTNKARTTSRDGGDEAEAETTATIRGIKRKFQLDEAELLKAAKEERVKARKWLDAEKVPNPSPPLPSP